MVISLLLNCSHDGVQALQLLPSNSASPLADVVVTPYMPVPETNGEEWDRLEPASALDVLVELALHGEYNGLFGHKRSKDCLELRAAALRVFDVCCIFLMPDVSSDELCHRTSCAKKRSSRQ